MNIPASEHIVSWGFWYLSLLIIHVMAGGIAMITFWIPLATIKGSPRHIAAGAIFLCSLATAILCAIGMIIMQTFDPVNPIPSIAHTLFFLYLCIFIFSAGWHGVRVYTMAEKPSSLALSAEKVQDLFSLFFGLAASLFGFLEGNWLYGLFPLIGVSLAIQQYRFWCGWPYENFKIVMNEHMRSMLSCVIAAFTAFNVIVVSDFLRISSFTIILWILPMIVFLPVMYYWKRRIKR